MDEVVELTVAECRDLLATDTVGRVAFVTPSGPRIVPVNYALDGAALEVRTTSYSELAIYAPGTEIAFEIDQLDSERRRGWSVVAHGVCERVEPAELRQLAPGRSGARALGRRCPPGVPAAALAGAHRTPRGGHPLAAPGGQRARSSLLTPSG